MLRTTYLPEEIIAKAREVEVLLGHGRKIARAVKAPARVRPLSWRPCSDGACHVCYHVSWTGGTLVSGAMPGFGWRDASEPPEQGLSALRRDVGPRPPSAARCSLWW
jgi:hypothetical protein